MDKYKFGTFLTVGKLKEIIKDMADDAIVSARDRDCISLAEVHIVGVKGEDKYDKYPNSDSKDRFYSLNFVDSISDVYGGDRIELENKSKQAIIFCDCD